MGYEQQSNPEKDTMGNELPDSQAIPHELPSIMDVIQRLMYQHDIELQYNCCDVEAKEFCWLQNAIDDLIVISETFEKIAK